MLSQRIDGEHTIVNKTVGQNRHETPTALTMCHFFFAFLYTPNNRPLIEK